MRVTDRQAVGRIDRQTDRQNYDDDEIVYFTVRWKTRELVLSTAPKT